MKKKSSKSNQVTPMDDMQDVLSGMFIGDTTSAENSVSQLMSTVIANSIELSKLVIENRVRNSEKLQDQDIYNIYLKSVKVAMKAMETLAD